MRRFLPTLPLLALAAALAGGCGKSESTASRTPPAPKAEAAVVWPALKAFDEAAEKAEGLAEKKDAAGARAALADIAATTQALVASTVPNNVQNPLTVKELLADAKELADALGKGTALADDAVLTLLGSVHPLAEKLMSESGLPHTHDGHDHGHDDHGSHHEDKHGDHKQIGHSTHH